jgi:bacterioferritin
MTQAKSVVALLNEVLATELTSINRYFLHARLFKHAGFEKLDASEYKKSIKDMKQADALIERILLLNGLPNLQKLHALKIGENPAEMLDCDLAFQTEQIAELKAAIAACEAEQDYVSRALLADILADEDDYADWLATQSQLIQTLGLPTYLQAQLED